MRKRSFGHFMITIIFLSIATILGEFLPLIYLDSRPWIYVLFTILIALLSHIILQVSYDYEVVFIYLFLTCLLNVILMITNAMLSDTAPILEAQEDWYLLLINFLVPCIYAWLRNFFDANGSIVHYREFFRNSSILFLLCYIVYFLCLEFFTPTLTSALADYGFPVEPLLQAYQESDALSNSANFIPFYTAATYIENYIYHVISFIGIFEHLLLPVCLYIPLGYYLGLWMHNVSKRIRLILAILIPIAVELLQFVLKLRTTNVDDILYGLIGIVLGYFLCFLLNSIYHFYNGHNFLETRETLHFSHRY